MKRSTLPHCPLHFTHLVSPSFSHYFVFLSIAGGLRESYNCSLKHFSRKVRARGQRTHTHRYTKLAKTVKITRKLRKLLQLLSTNATIHEGLHPCITCITSITCVTGITCTTDVTCVTCVTCITCNQLLEELQSQTTGGGPPHPQFANILIP